MKIEEKTFCLGQFFNQVINTIDCPKRVKNCLDKRIQKQAGFLSLSVQLDTDPVLMGMIVTLMLEDTIDNA